MSLFKQLLASVSVAMMAILLGTVALSTAAARAYLDGQLRLHSENAVTGLALSLSQPGNQDPVTQELLLAALFDTGQFGAVRLRDPSGQLLFERQQPADPSASQPPSWFQRWMPLPAVVAERPVSNGWQQLGQVEVTVANRQAQSVLWDSALHMSGLVLGAGAVWAVFVTSLLRWFRRVLQQEVAAQVLRIGTEQPLEVAPTPQVAELSDVSSAIQSAQARVQRTERVQRERIEVLELETNSDPITGLPNRKYFLNELSKALQQQTEGHVLLVRQRDLQELNQQRPRQEVDAWLRSVTQQLQAALPIDSAQPLQMARLNGSDCVLLLPGQSGPSAMRVVQAVRSVLQPLRLPLADGQWTRWAYVLTAYTFQDSSSQVLARLDQALMHAESAGHGEVEYAERAGGGAAPAAGEGHWQQVLAAALQQPEALQLRFTPVHSVSLTGRHLRYDASLCLHESDGHWLEASLFLPAALRLGYSAAFDLQAVSLAASALALHADGEVVVRMSLASLEHDDWSDQLQQVLAQARAEVGPVALQRLVLELDAYAFEAAPEAAFRCADAVAQAGALLGLRRLEQAPKALLHLPGLRLHAVKLGGFFAQQSLHNAGARHLLEAMVATAQAQAAQIWVTDSVAPEAADWLRVKGALLPAAPPEKSNEK